MIGCAGVILHFRVFDFYLILFVIVFLSYWFLLLPLYFFQSYFPKNVQFWLFILTRCNSFSLCLIRRYATQYTCGWTTRNHYARVHPGKKITYFSNLHVRCMLFFSLIDRCPDSIRFVSFHFVWFETEDNHVFHLNQMMMMMMMVVKRKTKKNQGTITNWKLDRIGDRWWKIGCNSLFLAYRTNRGRFICNSHSWSESFALRLLKLVFCKSRP